MDTHTKNKMRQSMLATTAAVFLTAGIALGFPGVHHSSQKSANIEVTEINQVPGGPTLEPGSYKVVLLNDSSTPEVAFYRNGKLIGQAPVKLVDQGKKFQQTEISANMQDDHTELITEMDLSGWTEKVIFTGSGASSASGQ